MQITVFLTLACHLSVQFDLNTVVFAAGRALKTFSTSVSVNNYPLRPILSQETNLLQKITQLRKIEIAENVVSC